MLQVIFALQADRGFTGREPKSGGKKATDGFSGMQGTTGGICFKGSCHPSCLQTLVRSNLDYPDFSIIRNFLSVPTFFMNINKS